MAAYLIEVNEARQALGNCSLLNPVVVEKLLESSKNHKATKIYEEFFLNGIGRIEYQSEASGTILIRAIREDGRKYFHIELDGESLLLEGIDFTDFFGHKSATAVLAASVEDFC